MANIYDVAKRAGVSVSTVSAVVNETAYVSRGLQARVRAAIEALGYRPNLLARSLAKQKSHMIGMIVPDIVNPFWPQVVRGAEDKAHQAGYTLLLSNSDDDPEKEALYLNVFLAKRVDGIIIAKAPGRLQPKLAAQLKAAKIPLALMVRVSPGLAFDRVVLDDQDSAYEAVTHLVRLGYQRIGIINGLPGVSSTRARLAGYKKALKDARRQLAPALICHGDFRVDSGYRGGLDLLKQKPDAVFITNYLMAVGFMRALRQYQLRCPKRRHRHLRRSPVARLVRARPDHGEFSEVRARTRIVPRADRSPHPTGTAAAGGRAQERADDSRVVRVPDPARHHGHRMTSRPGSGQASVGARTYDVLAMGRSCIDLYAHQTGVPITAVTSYDAYVGGCPTNVIVGSTRLGLRTALLTAVGDDEVADHVLHFLRQEGVETKFIPRKPGRRTSAVIVTIRPPDDFPITFYRDNCADDGLTIEDVERSPIGDSRLVFVTGTGLSREPSRTATLWAAEQGRAAGATVVLNVDYRPALWPDAASFGSAARTLARMADLVVGTEQELEAATGQAADRDAVQRMLDLGAQAVVLKRGAAGATIWRQDERADVPPFEVEILNTLGAGDAFASGFLYGYLQGWPLERAARLGNASGAIVVGRHGCSIAMPRFAEIEAFVAGHGGW